MSSGPQRSIAAAQVLRKDLIYWNEDLITKLKQIRYYQSTQIEDCISDYSRMTLKLSKDYAQIQSSRESYRIVGGMQEASEILRQENEDQLIQYVEKLKNDVEQQKASILSYEREQSNLKNESLMKSNAFQNEVLNRITEEKAMPFLRLSFPIKTIKYVYNAITDIIAMLEKDQIGGRIVIYSINDQSVPQFSIQIPKLDEKDSVYLELSDKYLLCYVDHHVEMWLITKQQRVLSFVAHAEPIEILNFLQISSEYDQEDVLLTCSKRGVYKIWQISQEDFTPKMMQSFRLEGSARIASFLRISELQQSQNISAHILAGMSDGSVKIYQIFFQQNRCDVIYNIQITNCKANIDRLSYSFLRESRNELQISNLIFAAASIDQTELRNIYIGIPSKDKAFSILSTYQNSDESKNYKHHSSQLEQKSLNFILTQDHLVAGSYDGSIFAWNVKNLFHPLMFHSPTITLKKQISTVASVPIMLVAFSKQNDLLITADEDGNILKWGNCFKNIIQNS